MSDPSGAAEVALSAGDFVSAGLPVYTIVSQAAESFGRNVLDMDDDEAKTFGQVTGAAASVATTITLGSP